ncbi:MAG: XylR family transcriptional regulator [Planctomycetia bacterium]|nr:XylR family transcriptional regulator [Planctomycetia bacterium]
MKAETSSRAPRVALLVETARSYGRGVLRGVARYSRLYGPWHFHMSPGDFVQSLPNRRDWRGDGVIARTLDVASAEAVLELGLPTVFLDFSVDQLASSKYSTDFCIDLTSDSVGAAQMAVNLLYDKGLTQFAYAGYPYESWSIKRERAFVAAVKERGYEAYVYEPPRRAGRAVRLEKEEPYLIEWLKSLPKPIGLMACNDQRGREALDACEAAGLLVPEHIAVVGVDADDVLCELCSPPLSSVALNAEKGGFLAAQALDDMMRGVVPKVRHILVEPVNVVERRSSNIILTDDPDVSAALQIIHTARLESLTVDRIAREIATSRRALEIKFRRTLGRTILEEIKTVRMERAKQALRETDATLDQVAKMVGFRATSYFIQSFRKTVGMTPFRYRRNVRYH